MNEEKEKREDKGKETTELLKLIAILLCVIIFLFSPLAGFIVLFLLLLFLWKPSKKTRQRVARLFGCVFCPNCGEPIERTARSCPACGATFPSHEETQKLAKLWKKGGRSYREPEGSENSNT